MDEENVNQEIQEDIPVVQEDWAYPKVFKPTFTLSNGTEFDGSIQKSAFSNKIWVLLHNTGYSYMQIVSLFGNPENTQTIRFTISPSETIEYTGYTNLATINSEPDGTFSVGLTKPET